jgi:uncharacterized protein YeaO (DUF488 family)
MIKQRADNEDLMAKAARVQVRRVYDPPQPGDGQRVLVDRLWRGVLELPSISSPTIPTRLPSAAPTTSSSSTCGR